MTLKLLENAARIVLGVQIVALTLRLPYDCIQFVASLISTLLCTQDLEKSWKDILFLVFPLLCLTWITSSFLLYGISAIKDNSYLTLWYEILLVSTFLPYFE